MYGELERMKRGKERSQNLGKRLSSGLGIWMEQEIENALRAIDVANMDIAAVIDAPEMQVYRKGYAAAINAMSEMFGLNYRSE